MAVDHGLGGKDSKKSREKREKRAKKQKAFARQVLAASGNKKEIRFDEAARVEYLTGFRKRKAERRKFGLSKKIEKEKLALKDARKERRKATQLHQQELSQAHADRNRASDRLPNNRPVKKSRSGGKKEDDEAEEEDDEENMEEGDSSSSSSKRENARRSFDDEYTRKLFGAGVVCEVQEGIGGIE